jgi:hypothetical protein
LAATWFPLKGVLEPNAGSTWSSLAEFDTPGVVTMTIDEEREEEFVAEEEDVERGESVWRASDGDGLVGPSSGACCITVGPVMITTSSVV